MSCAEPFHGRDDSGQPLYRDTPYGPECTQCGQLDGRHNDDCPNLDYILHPPHRRN
jgi:hypothetical protein